MTDFLIGSAFLFFWAVGMYISFLWMDSKI